MQIKDFSFNLPERLIAQHPPKERGTARLLVLDKKSGRVQHLNMKDLPDLIDPDTLMVFNNTRVRNSRLWGTSDTGGKVECFLLKRIDTGLWEVLVSKAKKQRSGKVLHFPGGIDGSIAEELPEGHRVIRFGKDFDDAYLEQHAHVPLPPYIRREDQPEDKERYQTVFSREVGSSAAPTAGLHFSEELIKRIEARGIETAYLTLHVGLGTFAPVRTENLLDHQMHREEYEVSEETAEKINRARQEGRKILAVGTTSVRTLESACKNSILQSGKSSTDLFIYPGYRFQMVDEIFTNFHTPESTLLVLVSAFAGSESIRNAYSTAIEEEYRFFSYGDAMYIR